MVRARCSSNFENCVYRRLFWHIVSIIYYLFVYFYSPQFRANFPNPIELKLYVFIMSFFSRQKWWISSFVVLYDAKMICETKKLVKTITATPFLWKFKNLSSCWIVHKTINGNLIVFVVINFFFIEINNPWMPKLN